MEDPAVRLPFVIANERFAPEPQPQRVDHQREFRQDQVALGHAERVHVRGSFDGDGRQHGLPARLLIDAEEVVLAPAPELEHITVMAAAGAVEVWVGGGDRPRDLAVVLAYSEGSQSICVEADGEARLGERDYRVRPLGDVNAASYR